MNEKPTIKIRIVDWWHEHTAANFRENSIVKILDKHFNCVWADKPDFLIYSVFGREHLNYDCVRIFYTGENVRPDFNIEGQRIEGAANYLRDARNLRNEIQKLHAERENYLRDTRNLRNELGKFTADGRNVGLFISKIQRDSRAFRHKLKFWKRFGRK